MRTALFVFIAISVVVRVALADSDISKSEAHKIKSNVMAHSHENDSAIESIFREVRASIISSNSQGKKCHPSRFSSMHPLIAADIAAMNKSNIERAEINSERNSASIVLSNERSTYSLSVEVSKGSCVAYEIYRLVE